MNEPASILFAFRLRAFEGNAVQPSIHPFAMSAVFLISATHLHTNPSSACLWVHVQSSVKLLLVLLHWSRSGNLQQTARAQIRHPVVLRVRKWYCTLTSWSIQFRRQTHGRNGHNDDDDDGDGNGDGDKDTECSRYVRKGQTQSLFNLSTCEATATRAKTAHNRDSRKL